MSTSPNANVGIDKQLTVEPTIINARGFREQIDDPEELKDVNLFSPQELLTPGTIRNDDPIRSSISEACCCRRKTTHNVGEESHKRIKITTLSVSFFDMDA